MFQIFSNLNFQEMLYINLEKNVTSCSLVGKKQISCIINILNCAGLGSIWSNCQQTFLVWRVFYPYIPDIVAVSLQLPTTMPQFMLWDLASCLRLLWPLIRAANWAFLRTRASSAIIMPTRSDPFFPPISSLVYLSYPSLAPKMLYVLYLLHRKWNISRLYFIFHDC